jgi:type I restriction-modification system DNA methylase subunit
MPAPEKSKSLESWIWDAACSIRGAKDAPKYKDYILPLIFTKRLCDVFDDDRLSNLIEAISTKRLGLEDVEADIVGKSYEYLIRKFAEGGGQSAREWSGATWTTSDGCPEGERGGVHQFYTPPKVGTNMSRVLAPEPGMEIYDPTCGSRGLLVKSEIEKERGFSNPRKGENDADKKTSPR